MKNQKKYKVTFLLDNSNLWIENCLKNENFKYSNKYIFKITKKLNSIRGQDIVFPLSYTKILSDDFLNKSTLNYNIIQLCYGEKDYDIRTIGGFNKFNPKFLHPEISTFEQKNNYYELVDKIIIEEDLTANFRNEKYYKKILKTLKGCPLII